MCSGLGTSLMEAGVTVLKWPWKTLYMMICFLQNDEIMCWDLRNPGKVFSSLKREVDTNQRIYFDLFS